MTTFSTPTGIAYVRLASLKGMVSLESKGLKGRAGPIRPRIAAELGLKPRAPYADFIAAIQARMETLLEVRKEELNVAE
jgi:hypothetical protein